MNLLQLSKDFMISNLDSRYQTLIQIEPILSDLNKNDNLSIIGYSVQNRPIYKYIIGNGKTKLYMWSQMHGDESTSTKAVLDFLNFLNSDNDLAIEFINQFTVCIIPMLNPDGAALYTRENANEIDLNRDAINLSQPESLVLLNEFKRFEPDYCFNLHDQRSIYGAGDSGKPAIVSFLAPSYNEERSVNESRQKAISVIEAINFELQKTNPGSIGRFDDTYNPNCVGDTFQKYNIPTILFEGGHSGNDYSREIPRNLLFTAFLSGLKSIYENDLVVNEKPNYLKIPQNKVNFYDFICRNVNIYLQNSEKCINFAVQYKEVLKNDKIVFEAYISQIDNLENFFGHKELDFNGKLYSDSDKNVPIIDQIANFKIYNQVVFENGSFKL